MRIVLFDGNTFTIDYLCSAVAGFQIYTRTCLRRHASCTPLPEARRIRSERDHEPLSLRVGPSFTPKVGIRNVVQQGHELHVDILPVTFSTYAAVCDPSELEACLTISSPAAIALALLTTESDGSRKLIVQHRSTRNRFYPDTPGASVAGFLDGQLDRSRHRRGTLLPIDSRTIEAQALTEAEEELGLKPADIGKMTVLGIATDRIRVHTEILLAGQSLLNAEEITKAASEQLGGHQGGSELWFRESFNFIPNSLWAIEALVAQMRCPLPPTHCAVFVAAGFSQLLAQTNITEANAWMARMEQEVHANYAEINRTVAADQENAAAETLVRGYDPRRSPTEQGLPSFPAELQRLGLLTAGD